MISLLLYGEVSSLREVFWISFSCLILQFWIGKEAVKYTRPVGHKSSELKYVQYVSKWFPKIQVLNGSNRV